MRTTTGFLRPARTNERCTAQRAALLASSRPLCYTAAMKPKRVRQQHNMLFGIGLDDPDGHVRITKGEDFRLYGGSKPTHEKMQELTLKSRERLKQRGKTFGSASRREIHDTLDAVAHKLGLTRQDAPSPDHQQP